jgi:hypothetical protein
MAVAYPGENGRTWTIVVERWEARSYNGTTVYPQTQLYRARIEADVDAGVEAVSNHLAGLGWTVSAPDTWGTTVSNAVQSAYVIDLPGAPVLDASYRDRPQDEQWVLTECLLRGISPVFAAELIDSGARTVDEIAATFDIEAVMRTAFPPQ